MSDPAPAPPSDWRRRLRRPPPAGSLACALRAVRILGLLLAATGCAIDGPRPVAGPDPDEVLAALEAPPVVSRFGEWRGEGGPGRGRLRHAGVDIRAAIGSPVLAAADGLVLRTGFHREAGRLVLLGHGEALATAYYHLSAILVAAGQTVTRGQLIGRAGRTGNAIAPHLHFGVCRRPDGQCGPHIGTGWDDPGRYWVAGSPCFLPGRTYAAAGGPLTYPVPCVGPDGSPVEPVSAPAARAAR